MAQLSEDSDREAYVARGAVSLIDTEAR